jgi:hypothetical protein
MKDDEFERLVVSFESIAESLKGLHEEAKRAGIRFWPGPKEQKQAVVSKVESDDERAKRNQGARKRTIADAIDPNAEDEDTEEFIGERTRRWLRDHGKEAKEKVANAGSEAPTGEEPGGGGTGTAEGQA